MTRQQAVVIDRKREEQENFLRRFLRFSDTASCFARELGDQRPYIRTQQVPFAYFDYNNLEDALRSKEPTPLTKAAAQTPWQLRYQGRYATIRFTQDPSQELPDITYERTLQQPLTPALREVLSDIVNRTHQFSFIEPPREWRILITKDVKDATGMINLIRDVEIILERLDY